MKLNDKVYDVLKYIVLIVLPACGTLYMAIAGVWGLPHIEQVVGTLSALGTFLGALICVSTEQYNKDKEVESEDLKDNNINE